MSGRQDYTGRPVMVEMNGQWSVGVVIMHCKTGNPHQLLIHRCSSDQGHWAPSLTQNKGGRWIDGVMMNWKQPHILVDIGDQTLDFKSVPYNHGETNEGDMQELSFEDVYAICRVPVVWLRP